MSERTMSSIVAASFALSFVLMSASACSPLGVAVGAGATAGIAVAQERTVEDALSDAEIKLRLNEAWFSHDHAMHAALSSTVTEGRVLVTGQLTDPDKRVDAIRIAWEQPGVQEVINEVNLVEKGGGVTSYAKDTIITTRLKGKLTFDREVASINYSIDTVGGVIYLMGVALSRQELERVLDHARTIPGVINVVSYVRLRPAVATGSENGQTTEL
ncbi:MAG: BON domain-containing protein [Alphaproteobacteria bacterium]